ncbi:MAG TPA: hypothetical protein DCZ41_02310 [Firmicutes bacterium]|nr:hypothetical protein [Bacillota bacterium]
MGFFFFFLKSFYNLLGMKLFCFDLDGTILDKDKIFRESTIASIRQIQTKGHAVCLASGRPFSGISPFLRKLDSKNLYAVAFNGAALYKGNGELLYENGFPFRVFLDFHDSHKDFIHNGVDIYCYTEHEVCSFESSEGIHYEHRLNDEPIRMLHERPLASSSTIMKFMVVSKDTKKIDEIEKTIDVPSLHTVRSDPRFFEFTKKGVDKSSAIERLRLLLHIEKREDVVTFGDAGNDFLMLKDYYGIAMGNATEECRQVAKKVTLDCKGDGVSYALTNWF